MAPPRSLILVLLFAASNAAFACGPAGNLIVNCSFDTDVSGYQAQKGGDVIAHEPAAGNLALGSMRVRDTDLDSDSEAEAETCVNLTESRDYHVAASFIAVFADTCLLGWDEFEAPDCELSNGIFEASPAVAVNDQTYTPLVAQLTASTLAQSVELVILCSTSNGEPEFLVDDVSIVPGTVFRNGFEAL